MAGVGGGYPVTPGYTINIVKEKAQQAVLLLNPTQTANIGAKSYYITVPEPVIEYGKKSPGDDLMLNTEKCVDNDLFYFVEDGTEEVICSEVIESDISGDSVTQRLCEVDSENVTRDDVTDHEAAVYYQENHPYTDPSVFFTEVAHEEVVIEEVDNVADDIKTANVKPGNVISCVQCDLCNSKLSCAEEAKNHMKHVHNILTYEGPFFKCEFCGIYVTDRVSHMKVAHYSPLAQGFCKTNNSYQCLQCKYRSDQLTNIRNHVDAKHSQGDNKYLCEECNSEYKTLNSMRAHKSRVHVKKRRLVELNQINNARDSFLHGEDRKLQDEILELEEKTFSKFVKRRNIL